MIRLFEKGRRYYEPRTEPYGRVLVLQVRSYLRQRTIWIVNDDVRIGPHPHTRICIYPPRK